MKTLSTKLSSIAVATSMALGATLVPQLALAESALAGNIGIHSQYVLRGIAEENSGAAVQGGLDYATGNGFYAGWWFSSLGYSYEKTSDGKNDKNGFENDFYLGYTGKLGASVGYDVGLVQYLYINADDSDLTELKAKLTYSNFYAGMQYLLTDGVWGNSGDIYWKAGYAMKLPSDFGLAFDYGYYTYDDNDSDKIGAATTSDSGFRHFNIALSHPVGTTGADMYIKYIIAGEDRTGAEHNDTMVAGITYAF